MEQKTTVTIGDVEATFAFDAETEDPAEGATLTFASRNGQRIHPDEVPAEAWALAARQLGIA